MASPRQALVIGGGVVGCAAAYYLARLGCQVRLLERGQLGSGASSGNCGFICPSHVLPMAVPGAVGKTVRTLLSASSPVAIRPRIDPALWRWLWRFARRCRREPMMTAAHGRHALLQASRDLYRQLLDEEQLDCQWQSRGLLLVFRSGREFDEFEQTARLLHREFHLQVTAYEGEAVTEFEPALRSGLGGGWLFPDDCHLRPDRLLAAWRGALERHGVEVVEQAEVQSLDIREGRLQGVNTSAGYQPAELAVVATGAEAPRFAKPLGCKLPIQPGKGYSLTLSPVAQPPAHPMIFESHHVAITPLEGALRIGSTMEFAGYDRSINRRRMELLWRSAREHLREVPETDSVVEWAGWRPMTYDGLPCIDRAPAADNVVVAAGNGMIGVASAPATGRLAAELAVGAAPLIDPQPYSLRRFATGGG